MNSIIYKIPSVGEVDYPTWIRWYYECMPELAEYLINKWNKRLANDERRA